MIGVRGYLIGPPPKDLLEARGKRWRGKGRLDKIVYLSCRDLEGEWKDLLDIRSDEKL